jgi:transmembrane sensor
MSEERPLADRLNPRNLTLSDEAIEWIVLLGSGSATNEDRAAFEEWRCRSPAHADAAEEAASILDDIARTRTAGDTWTFHPARSEGGNLDNLGLSFDCL